MFPNGRTGIFVKRKNLSLKSSVLSEKKGLHFESFSDFVVFVPKYKCFQKKKKKKKSSSLRISLGFHDFFIKK